MLATWSVGLLTRMTRASMLSVLPQDFLRCARSKGASEFYVIRRHAAPNAMIPVVTVIGLAYGDLLSGALLVETIFGWPGIGRYAFNAAVHVDFPAIIGVALTVGFIYTIVNLAVDIDLRPARSARARLAAGGARMSETPMAAPRRLPASPGTAPAQRPRQVAVERRDDRRAW